MQINLKILYICAMGKTKINRIKEVMSNVGAKSKFVANAIGKDVSTFSAYYNNNRQPPLIVLVQIAKALRVSPSELIVKEVPGGIELENPLQIEKK